MNEQTTLFSDNPEYDAFVDKFKPKKTTDDCYTPPIVYEAIADWVAEEYGLDKSKFVRPFWPGGDFEAYQYEPDAVVVDNPPFSIFAKIVQWYQERKIRFFLFGPALTLFSRANVRGVAYIPVGADVTYENGAVVKTSFVTNLDRWKVRSAPDLYQTIKKANARNLKAQKKELPKYTYPDQVITAAIVQWYSIHGVDFRVREDECRKVSELDAQKDVGKAIFGGGFLLAERAAAERAAAERTAAERAAAERTAAERAAAERAAAHKWTLSDRELAICRELSGYDKREAEENTDFPILNI